MRTLKSLVTLFLCLIFNNILIVNGAAIYTGADGDWTGHIWSTNSSGAPLCSGTTCSPACNFSGVANIKNKVIAALCSGTLTISGGGSVTLTGSTSRLTVSGNLIVTGSSTITIPANDTLYVNGDLTVSSTSTINVNGYIKVTGNVSTSGSSSVCGTGGGIYTGTLTGPTGTPGWCFAPVTVPIQLLSFNAEFNETGNYVTSKWVTATELNNNYFTIERTKNGDDFETIGKVNGVGNSNQIRDYIFNDYNPYKGISYYRLTQTDYNGSTTIYFKAPVEVTDRIGNSGFMIFPNPTNESIIYITLTDNQIGDQASFILKDIMGKVIIQETFTVTNKGSTIYKLFPESKLSKGIYFISGFVDNNLHTQKLIIN